MKSETKVALDVALQWLFCNIYPKHLRTIENDVMPSLNEYKSLKERIFQDN